MKITVSLLALLALGSCTSFQRYGDEVQDMAARVDVGVGFAWKDGYVYGPLRGRLKPSERAMITRENLAIIPPSK